MVAARLLWFARTAALRASKMKLINTALDQYWQVLQVISYKWLARHFDLSCNVAKQALFAFLEKHRGKVKATYLLAGWTTGEPPQHVVQLVDSEQLTTSRSALDPVTSMHVYSLQPTQPKVRTVCNTTVTPCQYHFQCWHVSAAADRNQQLHAHLWIPMHVLLSEHLGVR